MDTDLRRGLRRVTKYDEEYLDYIFYTNDDDPVDCWLCQHAIPPTATWTVFLLHARGDRIWDRLFVHDRCYTQRWDAMVPRRTGFTMFQPALQVKKSAQLLLLLLEVGFLGPLWGPRGCPLWGHPTSRST